MSGVIVSLYDRKVTSKELPLCIKLAHQSSDQLLKYMHKVTRLQVNLTYISLTQLSTKKLPCFALNNHYCKNNDLSFLETAQLLCSLLSVSLDLHQQKEYGAKETCVVI